MSIDVVSALDTLTVLYQPVVELDTGAVAGFEALARIPGAGGEVVSIEPVIAEIEDDPVLLERFMRRLLHAIRDDIVPVLDKHADVYVSVNVPPALLGRRTGRRMLEELNLIPYLPRFVCEVTERQALTREGRAALASARDNRIRVALDDFGAGHSGIVQLLGLTIDMLKMDRSQVVLVTQDAVAERLVRGILALAAFIRARVVAEGVENAAQAYFLQAAGVDYGQGWFWSAAQPADKLSDLIERGFPDWRSKLTARLNDS